MHAWSIVNANISLSFPEIYYQTNFYIFLYLVKEYSTYLFFLILFHSRLKVCDNAILRIILKLLF